MSARAKAISQALAVTFFWSTSWVLIKFGLQDVPPLLFAGLRYTMAALILVFAWLITPERRLFRQISPATWLQVLILGTLYYAMTQGSQFLGLNALPAVAVNLILGLSTPVTALLGTFLLREKLTLLQWGGITLTMAGTALYFFPIAFNSGQITGILIVFSGMIAGSFGNILARDMNRANHLPPLTLTAWSMLIGGVMMLAGGIATEGFPPLPASVWWITLYMAVVNTSVAFTYWNKSMKVLTAAESSTINNSMMIQVPILAVIFLGEQITLRQLAGMAVIIIGIVLVQFFRKRAAVPADTVPGSETGSEPA